MDDEIYFESLDDLQLKLSEIFRDLDSSDMRHLLFFLQEFKKANTIPKGAKIYISEVNVSALEVKSKEKISPILIGGVEKFISLRALEKSLPPVIVVIGGMRSLILYGEATAVEAYFRKMPVRAITIDVGDNDPFEALSIDSSEAILLVPFIESYLEKR